MNAYKYYAYKSKTYEIHKKYELDTAQSGMVTYGPNWEYHNQWGVTEVYVEGSALERGDAIGALTQDQIRRQEQVFIDQINTLIPSTSYRNLLHALIRHFNRKLEENVPAEYLKEIYGLSQYASSDYNFIGDKYHRILNYHSAHDIGHALQNYMLVGCTSFVARNEATADSSLLVGRNFDFYVGDAFARDKIILIEKPDKGYKFISITWGGMIGVLSGMNEKGVTVTLNAAKSDIPTASSTPISIIAREILQYASSIDEAYAIAKKHRAFVSESLLISSAVDHSASLIEISPNDIDIVPMTKSTLVSTNFFQGEKLGPNPNNIEFKTMGSSLYRHQRVEELLREDQPLTSTKVAEILRDRAGKGGEDIGLGNEKSINQLIAHHGVIFKPEQQQAWFSTAPYQLGEFIKYDLHHITAFSKDFKLSENSGVSDIAEDPFIHTAAFHNYEIYRKERLKNIDFSSKEKCQVYISLNPNSYAPYLKIGNYFYEHKDFNRAVEFYHKCLKHVVENKYIIAELNKRINEYEKK
ncbi:C45 family peptidase [Persicobacter psychrovividus]